MQTNLCILRVFAKENRTKKKSSAIPIQEKLTYEQLQWEETEETNVVNQI
jgi:hypothetical protein